MSKAAKKILDRKKKNQQKLKIMEQKMKNYLKPDETITRNYDTIGSVSNNGKSETSMTHKVRYSSKPAGKTFSEFRHSQNIKQSKPGYSSSVCNVKQFKQFFPHDASYHHSVCSYSKNISEDTTGSKLRPKVSKKAKQSPNKSLNAHYAKMNSATVNSTNPKGTINTLYKKTEKHEKKFTKIILDMESGREKAIFCKRGKRKIELMKQSNRMYLLNF